jgi:hypothetical protein
VSRNLFAELRRRNVIRMAGLYAVAGWLIVQVSGTVLPMFAAPDWLPRSIVVLLAIGFVPSLVFAWVYEITPEGVKRESEKSSATSRSRRKPASAWIARSLARWCWLSLCSRSTVSCFRLVVRRRPSRKPSTKRKACDQRQRVRTRRRVLAGPHPPDPSVQLRCADRIQFHVVPVIVNRADRATVPIDGLQQSDI